MISNAPTVDVVIPLYNKADYVVRSIESVLQQSLPVKSIYIADDASTDGSAEIVMDLAKRHRNIHFIPSPFTKPSGPSATRNRALAKSKSDFVAFLDADDWWEPEKLACQIPLFQDKKVALHIPPTNSRLHCLRSIRHYCCNHQGKSFQCDSLEGNTGNLESLHQHQSESIKSIRSGFCSSHHAWSILEE